MEVNWKNEKGNHGETRRVVALSPLEIERRLHKLTGPDSWKPPRGVTADDEAEMLLSLQDAHKRGLPR